MLSSNCPNVDAIIVADWATLEQSFIYLQTYNSPHCFIDVETDGVNEKECNLYGIAVAVDDHEAFYFVIRDQHQKLLYTPAQMDALAKKLAALVASKPWVNHNAVFDIGVLKSNLELDLAPSLHADTILMKHTVDEERPHGLKETAVKYLGEWADNAQDRLKNSVLANGGKWLKDQKDMYKADTSVLGEYACWDVVLTCKLFYLFEQKLKESGQLDFFYNKEVMPLYKLATIPMRQRGMFVDVPYFEKLRDEVEAGIAALNQDIKNYIAPLVVEFEDQLLATIKTSKSGTFAKKLLEYYDVPVPVNATTGKETMARAYVEVLAERGYGNTVALQWVLDDYPLCPKVERAVRTLAYYEQHKTDTLFNIGSNQHLAWLLFDKLGHEPKSRSRVTGAPQVNKDSLEEYAEEPFIDKLLAMKKEEKLLATYILPILEKQRQGWIYPAMLQFGTTSGRYSCGGGLNLQTLPRDDKRIKKGFIAPPGWKVVNADFSALEPRAFSWVTNDPGLKAVWNKKLDLYSQIAIDVFGLKGVSANKKDPNYLGSRMPEKRQEVKVFALAVPYGANSYRIAQLMKIDPDDAQDIVNKYLNAYPGLKKYMHDREMDARFRGRVTTQFGRIRHLDGCAHDFAIHGKIMEKKRDLIAKFGEEAGTEAYYNFRNGLNNAKNAPIQMTAAHICNAAMIKLAHSFRDENINGFLCLQVHDEITCLVEEGDAQRASELLQDAMENNWVTHLIDVPIVAEPVIASSFAEAK